MELQYKYWQLERFKIITFDDINYPTRNHTLIFFTNAKHISRGIQKFKRIAEEIKTQLEIKGDSEINIQSLLNFDLDNFDKILILINEDQQHSRQLADTFMRVREILAKNNENEYSFLTNASFYQKVQDDTIHSRLPAHHYLITPSVLISSENYDLAQLWVGEGWLAPTIYDKQINIKELEFNGFWIQFIDDQLYQLAERCSSNSLDIDSRKQKYLHILEACLPFQKRENDFFIPSHTQPWSGPFRISKIGPTDPNLLLKGAKNSSYHSVIRDLILEGWLSMWQDKQQQYIAHTSSFALLYWTAKYLRKKYTETPNEFLTHYQILPEAGWFGGKWDKKIIEQLGDKK